MISLRLLGRAPGSDFFSLGNRHRDQVDQQILALFFCHFPQNSEALRYDSNVVAPPLESENALWGNLKDLAFCPCDRRRAWERREAAPASGEMEVAHRVIIACEGAGCA